MDERYKRLSSHFQTRSKNKTENEVCRSIVIKSQPDEHVVEEIEVGPGSHSSSPVSDFPNGDSPIGEIIVKDEYLDFDFDDGSSSNKWSHKNVLRFLESFNQVLNTEERNGGFLSRKNLFARVTALMNDKGISFTQTETEKKYNNMLMTYRRCQQKLLRLRKTPSWPYFKMMSDLRQKVDAVESASSEFQINRLAQLKSSSTKGLQLNSPLGGYSFISSLPSELGLKTPGCLSREWHKGRRLQEERKSLIIRKTIFDRNNHRVVMKENRKKLMEAIQKENGELNSLTQEFKKGRVQCAKEMRFLAQDAVYLAFAVRSIRSKAQSGE